MERFFIILFLFISVIRTYSQPEPEWVRRYDNSSSINTYVSDMKVDKSGNVYLAGSNSQGLVTIKYNTQGALKWMNNFDSLYNYENFKLSLCADDSGNVFVMFPGSIFVSSIKTYRECVTLIKYSPVGDLLWRRKFINSDSLFAVCKTMIIDDSSNVYIAAEAYVEGQSSNYVTFKYDRNGNYKWPGVYDNEDGTSILLPLRPDPDTGGYTQAKVLIVAGDKATTCKSAQIIDLGTDAGRPRWVDLPSLKYSRTHQVNSVILANGHILVAGGALQLPDTILPNDPPVPKGGPCEILDPDNLEAGWFQGADLQIKRWYHSAAILQLDGTVLMGGDDEGGQHTGDGLPLEIYKPSYYFEDRPVIHHPSGGMLPDMGFSDSGSGPYQIELDTDPEDIVQVALIRPGSVTHGFNMDQRYIELGIRGRGPNYVEVYPPTNEFVAPAGYYMVIVLTASVCVPGHEHDCGPIPSIAKWIRVTA